MFVEKVLEGPVKEKWIKKKDDLSYGYTLF